MPNQAVEEEMLSEHQSRIHFYTRPKILDCSIPWKQSLKVYQLQTQSHSVDSFQDKDECYYVMNQQSGRYLEDEAKQTRKHKQPCMYKSNTRLCLTVQFNSFSFLYEVYHKIFFGSYEYFKKQLLLVVNDKLYMAEMGDLNKPQRVSWVVESTNDALPVDTRGCPMGDEVEELDRKTVWSANCVVAAFITGTKLCSTLPVIFNFNGHTYTPAMAAC